MHFSKNITRDKHGRYMVPFKDHKQLGELRTAVFKRLYSLECKLKPKLEDSLFTNYSRILHGLKSPGIFNENKRFLGKIIFIPQHSCLRGRYTWYSDFPTFRCPFCTKRPSKYASVSAMTSSFDVNLFPWSHRLRFGNR